MLVVGTLFVSLGKKHVSDISDLSEYNQQRHIGSYVKGHEKHKQGTIKQCRRDLIRFGPYKNIFDTFLEKETH